MSTRVHLEALEVGYNGNAILPPITASIAAGEQWAVIGPNGSGKSTLLRTILGLQRAIRGSVTLHGRVGYVPQRTALNRDLPARVIDMVRSGGDIGWSFLSPGHPRKRRTAVEHAMRDTDTLALANHPFQALSEGQKQRVLVARALASDPQILVLDEPSAAMDHAAEEALFQLLRKLRADRDLVVVLVSHHLTVATHYATHAIFVDKDRNVAITATMAEVAHDERAQARYGEMLVCALCNDHE